MAAPTAISAMFREVTIPSNNSARWKTITICTGASASTLQDIKVPESSGGYAYLPSPDVRNRFIYWRTYQDVLELVEESLDVTLSGNMVRYRFQDSAVLPSVTIQETHGTVVVLVTTVASVHRLVFPHPNRVARQQTFVLNKQMSMSVFYDASLPDDPRNQFLLTPGGSINAQLVRATSCVTADGYAIFAMATTTGSLLHVKMPPIGVDGVVIQQDLSCSSVMKKLWNGLIPGAMRGAQPAGETALSLEMIFIAGDVFIFTVCRDFRLRVWSTKNKDCVLTTNLLHYTEEEIEDSATPVPYTGSCHVLKAVLGQQANSICVFLSLQNKTKFVFLKPVVTNGRIEILPLTVVDKSPLEDLVDFVATELFLLTLWTTKTGDTQVQALPLAQRDVSVEWENVHLCQPSDHQVVVQQHCDCREVYLAKIFSPGLFAPQDILKALSVYRKCAAPVLESDVLINLAALKEEVTNAVDTEIRNSVSDYEVQEEAYVDLQREEWEKFYSFCCQYKQVGEKAKGLFADPVTGLFGIIKKSTFSLLRPCERTEMLYLSPKSVLSDFEIEAEGLAGDDLTPTQFSNDVRRLCDAVQLTAAHIEPELALTFYSSLQSFQEPEEVVAKMITFLRADQDFIRNIHEMVQSIVAPVHTIETILEMLKVTDDDGLDLMDGPESSGHAHYAHLFSGSLGLMVLTQGFQQLSQLRFNFTRDLVVLISIITQPNEKNEFCQDSSLKMMRALLPTGFDLLRCYKVLVWASDALSTVSPNNTLDINLRQLANLDLADNSSGRLMSQHGSEASYLISLFLESVGGEEVRRRLSALGEGSQSVWVDDLQQFLMALAVLIWPASDASIFPEFMVRSCQYLRLEEFSHLLDPWCTWNEASRAFFLGLAYLHFDEPLKAMKMFQSACDGVATETFLLDKLLQTEETDFCKLKILYFLKIIKHLEDHGLPDLVIAMATEAIGMSALQDDPNLPTLHSKIFMQHLELGHNQKAFAAMMSNPDTDRRKDCLRQFLVVLCERGNLADLVSFNYQDLEEEVVYILENRARSVDLSTHDYYKLLFSFFIHREDYRKAGRVMFERSLRLSQEVSGLHSLQQQAQSYLAALNTLRLVEPEYAWFVKPVLRSSQQQGQGVVGGQKHALDGSLKNVTRGPKQLEIVELKDLQKEYLLLDARLRLIRNQPDSALVSGPMLSAQELLSLLCSAGLYDVAMSVTRAFSMQPDTVLSSLALRCVAMATQVSPGLKHQHHHTSSAPGVGLLIKSAGQDPTSEALGWLKENNIPPCGAREVSAADKAWSLLQSYLPVLEDGSGRGHKCVAHTLLSQGFHLPAWLVNSYKELDVSSLLRIYLTYDLLTPAANLMIEYLESVTESLTGADEPAFKIKGMDVVRPQTVWVPYTSLDQLLAALREANNPSHTAMFERVREKLDKYQNKSFEISQEIYAF